MKKLLLFALGALFIHGAPFGCSMAVAQDAPYSPEVDARFKAIEQEKVLKAVYDTAVNGGSVASYGLGVYLPANAIVKQNYYYVTTQFADSGSGTVAFTCEDAGNLAAAADLTGKAAGNITLGAAIADSASTWVSGIASKCEVTATVAGSAQSAGKATMFIHYFVP